MDVIDILSKITYIIWIYNIFSITIYIYKLETRVNIIYVSAYFMLQCFCSNLKDFEPYLDKSIVRISSILLSII